MRPAIFDRPAPVAPLVEVVGLGVTYATPHGALPAVRDASLRVDRGEVLGIVGESGSGKSTLAHAVMGYRSETAETSGRVLFDGASLLDASPSDLRALWGSRIAMVHQNPLATQTPTMAVGAQIAETIRQHRGVPAAEARARAVEALGRVKLRSPAELARRYPHELSGGERQRVSIAAALCLEPDLLILDEPTTNLDATTEAAILDLLEDIAHRVNGAMIYISHSLGVIARMANRVAVMYAGEVVEVGAARDMFHAPAHPYTSALLACLARPGITKRERSLASIPGELASMRDRDKGCVFRQRCSSRLSICEERPTRTVSAEGHELLCWNPGKSAPPGGAAAVAVQPLPRLLLEAEDVVKSYPARGGALVRAKLRAVRGVSLSVPESAIVGLVGESGSGKSTVLRCIAGLETADDGRLSYLGVDLPASVGQRGRDVLKSIQLIFQDPESSLNPAVTVGENLRRQVRALRPELGREVALQIDRALEQVQLGESYRDRLPRELSGGEKQRVAIARALLSEPSLVLCDEPLSALDVSVQAAICRLLLELQEKRRLSYVFVSHDLSIVRYMSDHVVVMYLGEVVEEGAADTFDALPLHPYSEALFSATPVPDPDAPRRHIRLAGEISEAAREQPGCIFSARCPRRKGDICDERPPDWQVVAGRRYRCHWAPAELARLQAEEGL